MELIGKYNVPGPRYTSYPTVPYWQPEGFSEEKWKQVTAERYSTSGSEEGISIYMHLPFCESLCTFCGCTTRITVNHAVEGPYIRALQQEWEIYLSLLPDRPVIREIHLGGGTPTFFSPENLVKITEIITKSGRLKNDALLGLEANPRTTTEAHLKVLSDLGYRRISLGIQDFDPVVQKAINRVQSFGQVLEVTQLSRKYGFNSINYDLIYGLPRQTMKSVGETIEKVKLLRPDRIAFYAYAHVPWIKPGQRSFSTADLPNPAERLELYKLGKNMLMDAGYVEVGMDHFALPEDELNLVARKGQLNRNFMGYTTQSGKQLIGLGVSAISDAWNAFAQNVKTVEGYIAKLEKGILPVFRGHLHTDDDLFYRQHILNIMCKFYTTWSGEDDLRVRPYLLALQEMERDGLVRIVGNRLSVTQKGRPFVRNVCMAFDVRMIEKQPLSEIFSATV